MQTFAFVYKLQKTIASVIYVKIRWVLGEFCVLCFLVCKVYINFAADFIDYIRFQG